MLMTKDKKAPSRGIVTDMTTITPDIAKAWMEQNTKNRGRSDSTIGKYACDMANGDWQLTGDAIRFSASGRLIDGQHRLLACIRSNTNFDTFVIYGLPDDVQDVVDIGKARTISDMLSLRGLANARRVSSALRALLIYKADAMVYRASTFSHAEITHALERHPNITKSVSMVSNKVPRTFPLAAISFLHYSATFLLRKPDRAQAMADVLHSGKPDYEGCAMHAFRERVIRQNPGDARVPQHVSAWTLFNAWNSFDKRAPVTLLRWQKTSVDIHGLERNVL